MAELLFTYGTLMTHFDSPIPPVLFILLLTSCGPDASPPHANHLIHEASPYLLQHAHNPVDWYPWGEAALDRARAEDKMLIISIGYAACHWCHVMERESFSDTTVARLMNEHFVAVKVDREERPDVDGVYLEACQLMTGEACGWPLNVFALPDGRPVWAGTYAPRKQWLAVLEYFIDLRRREGDKLEAYAGRLLSGIEQAGRLTPPAVEDSLTLDPLNQLTTNYLKESDPRRGGRRGAPKFPMPPSLEFLLAYHHATGDEPARTIAVTTLAEMARGGIYDQLGGGFARYAVDADWHTPHFEKMLYDNAQLVSVYAHTYQLSGDTLFRRVVEETLAFLGRELRSPEGAFYASLDADSEGVEGRYYVWTPAEIDSLLGGGPAAALLRAYYGVTPAGNWENGKNVLDPERSLRDVARELGLTDRQAADSLREGRRTLLRARERRPRPRRDDKILTAWNALAISAYVDAYNALGRATYLETARTCARFLLEYQLHPDGRLRRAHRSPVNGFLDDYALTARAFIDLYQATFDESWLRHAQALVDYALARFSRADSGLLYYTSDLDPPLVTRRVDVEDNVMPSANSTMARVLFDLGLFLTRDDYLDHSRRMLRFVTGALTSEADLAYYANWARHYLDLARPPYEVVIAGPGYAEKRAALMRRYLPNARFLGGAHEGSLELMKGKLTENQTLIYVCRNKACKLPVQEAGQAVAMMKQ